MKKLYLIIILIAFTSFQITKNEKLPNGFWRNVFFSERGYNTSSNGKSLDETFEFKDSNVILIPEITCGIYIDDSLAIDYCVVDNKRVLSYSPADDIIADFDYYYQYTQKGDTIDFLPFTNLNTIFKYCNDTLVIQGKYRTLKFVKEKDQKTPIFIIPDSVYYPYNP